MNIFKSMSGKIGLGVVLCAACCALPLVGLLGSTVALSASFLSGGLECLLLAFLSFAGIGVWMARRRKPVAEVCKTSCDMGCGCGQTTGRVLSLSPENQAPGDA